MTTATYSVPGISCGHCVDAITSAVGAVAGVQSVAVDLETKTVTVVAEPFDMGSVIAAIDAAGYDVER